MSTGPKQQVSWDWRAAGNFIGGGSVSISELAVIEIGEYIAMSDCGLQS